MNLQDAARPQGARVSLDDDKVLARLERLGRLKEQGALTQDEFDAEKARLLTRSEESERSTEKAAETRWSDYRRHLPWGIAALAVLVAAAGLFGGSLVNAENDAEIERHESSQGPSPELPVQSQPQPIVNLSFEAPSTCTPEGALADALTTMRSLVPSPKPVQVSADGLGPVVVRVEQVNPDAAKNVVIAETALRSRLDGLTVVGLRTSRFGDDVFTTQIRFKESAERVRKSLNSKGYDIPAIGELRPGEIEEDQAYLIGVEELPSGSALTCAHTSV